MCTNVYDVCKCTNVQCLLLVQMFIIYTKVYFLWTNDYYWYKLILLVQICTTYTNGQKFTTCKMIST